MSSTAHVSHAYSWRAFVAEYERVLIAAGEPPECIGIVDRAHLYHWFERGESPRRTAAGDFPSRAKAIRSVTR